MQALAARQWPRVFDLYLIHAPVERSGEPYARPLVDMWREMEALHGLGLARSVGVSNFRARDLGQLEAAGLRVPIACNQVEVHPLLQQPGHEAYCAARGILVTGFSPLAPLVRPPKDGGALPLARALAALVARRGKTPAQVLLRWGLQGGGHGGRGLVTTTTKPQRLAEYLAALDFALGGAEVAELSAAGARCPSHPLRAYFWKQLGPPGGRIAYHAKPV